MTRTLAILPLLLGLTFGCTAGPMGMPKPAPGVHSTVLSFDLMPFAKLWEAEVREQHPNAAIIMAHGQVHDNGKWYLYPSVGDPLPVREAVLTLRAYYPDRRIVLVVCNPGGLRLPGLPRVSYALDNVWAVPDPETEGITIRDMLDPDVVGSIDEFIHQ